MSTTYRLDEQVALVNRAIKLYVKYLQDNPEDTHAFVKCQDWIDKQYNNEFNNQERFWVQTRFQQQIDMGVL